MGVIWSCILRTLLECPTSRKPLRGRRTAKFQLLPARIRIQVVKVGETDPGTSVVRIHGVDGFAELSAGRLVDAAGVDPNMSDVFGSCKVARLLDLGEAWLGSGLVVEPLELGQADFSIAP